ncbi:2Fe-2S iron-sulfur cluster binding domain-containing protein [Chitinophaga pendula]|uniref:flavin reductase family protein n=1 Tax=Chitinophaga TaxID=79328 RepID=UPI000BB05D20|nr:MULTISPECIES: 2Fe-2S iron-sulfur cluster-binding protein [Chitinophaga]ASZ09979.1 oxidoreductase [Chitinophaga sp. MD30]UCJ07078.1 2Fe-2S iron-sulfur cluster binding domain-containing protein [Chitinophaga pendula]
MAELYLQLRITAVIAEAPDTFTYHLENTEGMPVLYEAGQFLTFLITLHNTEYRRSYSFSSTPGIDDHLSVTIRKKENGEISRYILSSWHVGMIVTALMPTGRFTPVQPGAQPRDIFLLGAGSGITPLFSLLKHILYFEPLSRVVLVYSNSTRERTIFYRQLETLAVTFAARLHIIHLFSSEEDHAINHPRRLNNILLEPLVKRELKYDLTAAHFFVCGPPDYMRMILLTLRFMGFQDEQLHKENFVVNTDVLIARTVIPQDTTEKSVQLRLHDQVFQIPMPGNKPILDSALSQGVALPYSCKGGVCGSCTARCTTGKVWMSVNEVLTDKELAEGFILTCVGYPVSEEITIEL